MSNVQAPHGPLVFGLEDEGGDLTGLTSVDGSVIIVSPGGPVPDLSVPAVVQQDQQANSTIVQTVGSGAWVDVPGVPITVATTGRYNILWNTSVNPDSNTDFHWRLAIDGVAIGLHLVHTAAGNFGGLNYPTTIMASGIALVALEVVTAQVILNSGVGTADVFEQAMSLTEIL